MSKYYAVTTINFRALGYTTLGEGNNAKELKDEATRAIAGDEWDKPKSIETQTRLINLRVITKKEYQQYKKDKKV